MKRISIIILLALVSSYAIAQESQDLLQQKAVQRPPAECPVIPLSALVL
jgi:hypothetical protein